MYLPLAAGTPSKFFILRCLLKCQLLKVPKAKKCINKGKDLVEKTNYPRPTHNFRQSVDTSFLIKSSDTRFRHSGSGQANSPSRPPPMADSKMDFKQGLQTCRSWSHSFVRDSL